MGTHAHGDKGVVVLLFGRRHYADVHMDVRGAEFMEHVLKLSEVLLDVLLDGPHLLRRVGFGGVRFLFPGNAAPAAVIGAFSRRLPGDLQRHAVL